MPASDQPAQAAAPKRPHRLAAVIVTAVVVVGIILSLCLIPYHSSSTELTFAPGSSATIDLSIAQAGWVTVHFDHPGATAMGPEMIYWMHGPAGMMFNHSMMRGADSYSFWSWGGTYHCGAGYAGSSSGMMHVWVNATWGLL